MLPSFEFRQRDAALRDTPKIFVRGLVDTGRIFRNEKNQIVFAVARGDYSPILRKTELRAILEDGEFFTITGDVSDDAYQCLWCWLNDYRWKLPRLNPERPWNPERAVRK